MFYSKVTGGFYDTAIHGDNIPADAVEISNEEHSALLEAQSHGKIIHGDTLGNPVAVDPPPPTPEQILSSFTAATQQRLDAFAKTRGYDGILSACTYATSAAVQFSVEGQYCLNARDATWSAAYALLADVESGARPMPTLEDVLAALPALAWPS
jgi:hypothetical protein